MIVLASAGKWLIVAHTLAAMVLLGSVTHQVVVAYQAWGGKVNPRLSRIYGATGAIACFITGVLGAVAYPAYRYYVRGMYLDRCAVPTSRLFDVKEDFALLALLLASMLWVVSRSLERQSPREIFQIYLGASTLLASLVWFNAVGGFFISLTRGMP